MPRYSEKFRMNAAKMVLKKGYSADGAARELGCSGESVRRWAARYSEKIKPLSPKGMSAEEQARYWRERCERAESEAEFLKKAAAYFAGEPR